MVNFNKALIVNSPKDNVREIDAIILSKFDTVDEKGKWLIIYYVVGAALSLTSATGKPILFVGVGQKYTHLKKLNVNTVVRALLQWKELNIYVISKYKNKIWIPKSN